MTPIESRNDTKLLMAVAGLVVTGALGIVLLAGLAAEDESEREQARVATPTSPPSVEPARRGAVLPTRTAPEIQLASFESAPPSESEPVEPTPDTNAIDPDADLVAEGLAAYASRDFERAALYFDAEIARRPERAWTHYMVGLARWKAGRLAEAVTAMTESARLEPTSVKTFVNLSRIHNDAGDPASGLEAARAALTLDGDDAVARFLEGRSLHNLGRLDEAAESLVASLAGAPDNGYVHNLLGLTRLKQQQVADALPALERAVELEPEVAYIRNNLGMALELNGQRSEAVASYRRGAEIDPAHAAVAANLARLEGVAAGSALSKTVAEPQPAGMEGETDPSVEVIEVAAAAEEVAP